MIVQLRTLLFSLVFTTLAATAMGDEAQDAQVEQGVSAYDEGDYRRAKDILLPLAEAGHPKAMNMVGLMHYDTPVFPNDPVAECDWYEKAANAGYPPAMYNMSICYEGKGRPDEPEMEKAWLLKATEHGYIPALINLAGMDQTQGEHYRHWMNKAVQHGSKYAQVSLWLQGYKEDVPDIAARDIICVSWNILILNGEFRECD